MALLTNSTITRVVQFGVETTEGTAVTCNKRFSQAQIIPGWSRTSTLFRPSTYKFPTISVAGRKWSAFTLRMLVDYNALPYVLASAFNYLAPDTTGSGAALIANWQNYPAVIGNVNVSKTYTIEWGVQTGGTYRSAGCHVVGFDVRVAAGTDGSSTCELEVRMIGLKPTLGVTLATSGVTLIAEQPARAEHAIFYSGTGWHHLATQATTLLNIYEYTLSVDGLYNLEWALNSGNLSWNNRYEGDPTYSVSVLALEQQTGADYTGVPFNEAAYDAGSNMYMRMRLNGAALSAGNDLAFLFLTNPGTGYTSAPTVGFTGGGGADAAATVTADVAPGSVTNGQLRNFNITNRGTGYTTNPTVGFTGGGGSGATAVAETDSRYSIIVDHCLLPGENDAPTPVDHNGLSALRWTLSPAVDSTAQRALAFYTMNRSAAL